LLVNYQGFSRLRAESPRLQGPVLTYFAVSQPLGFTLPMPISTAPAAIVFVVSLLFSRETRGREPVPQLTSMEKPA
jgi:hypothetical protein